MKLIKHISSGCFGSVDLYEDEKLGLVAVKKFFRPLDDSHFEEFEKARGLWERSKQDFLEPFKTTEEDGHLWIHTRFFDGSEFDPSRIKDKEKVAKKLCRIFSVLNKEQVYFSDINSRNILLNKEDDVFLVDFDCPSFSEADYYNGEFWINPPEFVEDGILGVDKAEKFQTWSLGLLLAQVFYGTAQVTELPKDYKDNPYLRATLDPNPKTRHIPLE
ncbi:putative serine/threonine protein kinase [Lausannevirus]|uniref:Putative serine/threonine protein kinase n=2 Tax=Lausannevirus TaxID=999883 RepID=A0A0N9Q0T2_9VIRU|nr:putative serine/threonine protein kinase [Lausannevirus]AEA06985.1 putative serine/threonine protein kinase [Lausannevirus]ALH06814.1 putative serine/threonine protein kinase [Port-miou virus]